MAQVTADLTPSMSVVPAGWSPVSSTPVTIATGARVFAYYHVVPATGDQTSWTWQLSSTQKWGAVAADFHGVDITNPWAAATATKVDATYTATSLSFSGLTTARNGSMLIGGIGADTRNANVNPPTSWTEAAESTGGQDAEIAYAPQSTAGPTGTVSWTFTAAGVAGWMNALQPASS